MRSAPWDNATEETQVLERQEDADAARDERRTAMGATLPPGMLSNPPQGAKPSSSSPGAAFSRRPTLLLLGLDLPASVRDEIRAGLDRGAPDLFHRHVVGADALPSLASAVQPAAVNHHFFEPCRGLRAAATAPTTDLEKEGTSTSEGNSAKGTTAKSGAGEQLVAVGSSNRGDEASGSQRDASERDTADEARTRAKVVQVALSEGKSVSLEVVPGPGLWARGRFLRDLEALLGGLDDGGGSGGGGASDAGEMKRSGPTVLLVEGHSRNRSGGGMDVSHGTKFMGEVAAPQRDVVGRGSDPGVSLGRGPEGGLPLVSLAARRAKVLLEEAAQCLHDLSTRYGETPSPFKAIIAPRWHAYSTEDTPQGEVEGGRGGMEAAAKCEVPEVTGSGSFGRGEPNGSLAAEGSTGMDLLLAACYMIIHPDRRYDLGEGLVGNNRRPAAAALAHGVGEETLAAATSANADTENARTIAYASRLARACRAELSGERSARGVAEVLHRGSALDAIPLETAIALRRLARHPGWPAASPRPDFAHCSASEAFAGWIVAAVAGGTELALEGGGGVLCPGGGLSQDVFVSSLGTEMVVSERVPDPGSCAGSFEAKSTIVGSEGETPRSLRDAQEERRREGAVLRGIEAALVDENVTVVDDDSPWLLPPGGAEGGRNGRNRRQCRSSEALNALMETVLRPFNVRASHGLCPLRQLRNVDSPLPRVLPPTSVSPPSPAQSIY